MTIDFINTNGDIVSDYELENMFDDVLDANEDWPTVNGIQFAPSRVLKLADPAAYREGLNNWIDSEGYDEYEGGE